MWSDFLRAILAFKAAETKTLTGKINLLLFLFLIGNAAYLNRLFTIEGIALIVLIVISTYISDRVIKSKEVKKKRCHQKK